MRDDQTVEVLVDSEPPTGGEASAPQVGDALVEEDLLVEDVSIDGMCGVY